MWEREKDDKDEENLKGAEVNKLGRDGDGPK
jgi:hypothetical protein